MAGAPPTTPTAPRPERVKVLPYAIRLALEAEVYDRLLELARRDFRKLEWEASYLLTKAINEQARSEGNAR